MPTLLIPAMGKFQVMFGLEFEKNPVRKLPGALTDGLKNENRTADISFSFKAETLEPAYRVIEEYRSKVYLPAVRDCRRFASDLARAVGLRIPSISTQLPADWLAELVEMNPK